MLPTYSFPDIKGIIRSFELAEINLLCELVNEEIDCYPDYESKAIFKMIEIQKKVISRNEVKLEYLLAYN